MHGRFRFHPIGQGLFYTGSIFHGGKRPYNFVYDCGEEYNRNSLKEAIDNHIKYLDYHDKRKIKTPPIIDFVVVSHLDYDHVVGVYNLQQKATINKYYLPYIGEMSNQSSQYVFDLLLHSSTDGENIDTEAIHWFAQLYKKGEIIEGFDDKEDIDTEQRAEEEKVYIINNTGGLGFNFTGADKSKSRLWRFHLFNKKVDPQIITKFEDKVKKSFGSLDPEVILKDKTNQKKLNDIYKDKEVFGGSNITSLVLVHYPLPYAYTRVCCSHYPFDSYSQVCGYFWRGRFKRCRYCHYCEGPFPAALTALTGDANFDSDMRNSLKAILDNSPSPAKILQVPHHGSNEKVNKDWDSLGTLKMNFDWYVIPFGYGNRYGHPHGTVVTQLNKAAKNFVFATQISFFEYEICLIDDQSKQLGTIAPGGICLD